MTMPIITLRHWLRVLTVALVSLLVATSCSDGADPADYFEALGRSQVDLEATVDQLFELPLAQEVGVFADEEPAELDADQDALVRRFMTEFWTGALDAMAVHRDALGDLDVPDSVRSQHDAYLDSIESALDARDAYLSDIASASGVDLLASFWEGTPEIDAFDDACASLRDEAVDAGLTLPSALCAE